MTGSCEDLLEDLALECKCEGWSKWILADYQPTPANDTEMRRLQKWNRILGYDYDIIYNGVANVRLWVLDDYNNIIN